MSKKRPFDPMGKGYDMETAKASGQKPVYNPEDKKMHWGSLGQRTGMVLKGRMHKTWNLHEITEAAMGAKSVFRKGRYYTEGAHPVDVTKKGVKKK